jgi:hypothetical protein
MNSEVINLFGLFILTILVFIGYKDVKPFSFKWVTLLVIIDIIYHLITYK